MQIIRGKIPSAIKTVVYGPEGIGKSTFASMFPDPLYIDTEGSTKHMDVPRLPKPSSWTMLLEQVRYVRDNPGVCGTLVLDTADWAEQLGVTHICAVGKVDGLEGFGYGKGHVYLAEEFGRLLNLLEEVVERGVNICVTAHATMRKFEQPDEMGAYDRWELKLSKKAAPLLKEWADMVLFANYKTVVVNVDNQGAAKGKNKAQGGRRIMYTTHHPCWDAKNRFDLAPELTFEFEQISHIFGAVKSADPVQPSADPPKPPQQSETAAPVPSVAPEPEAPPAPESDDLAGLPQALADLMRGESVTRKEITFVVAQKGYYPMNTPIERYDPGFIDGVLVAAWPQVLGMIQEARKQEIPF